MNIVQAYSLFFPNYGGIEKHVYSISRELTNRGHKLSIFTTNLVNSRPATLPKTSMVNSIIVSRHFAFTVGSITICPMAFLGPKTSSKDTVLHVHSLNTDSLFVPSVLQASVRKLPIVVTPHFHPLRLQLESLKFKAYFELVAKKLLKRVDAVVALTPTEKQYYENEDIERVYEIPNGVDLSNHTVCEEKMEAFDKAHDPGKTKILFVGRTVENKNLKVIIESLPFITKDRKEILLYIVGSYTQHARQLQALVRRLGVARNVRFFFNVSENDLPYYYEVSDLVVLPSKYEAFGIVMLEAWAHKKPVVVSNRGGMKDVVSQGGGVVMNTFKPEKWASTLIGMLNDERQLKRLGDRGHELILEKYTWSKVAQKLVEVYDHILD